jgi:hypothetical protein
VLNCYSYTGGFSVAALAGGAQQVDQRRLLRPGAEPARDNVRRNGFDGTAHCDYVDADVNAYLREALAEGRSFDAFDWTTGYPSQRSPVFARNVVATSHPLAAQAGLRMLQRAAMPSTRPSPRRRR